MKNRLIAVAVGLLFLAFAAPHEAAACFRCAYGGSACGLDGCDDVWVCKTVNFGGGGSNDCSVNPYGCDLSGGFCMWASNISPLEKSPLKKPQVWAPVCHETNS
jgi:hypothetical protein